MVGMDEFMPAPFDGQQSDPYESGEYCERCGLALLDEEYVTGQTRCADCGLPSVGMSGAYCKFCDFRCFVYRVLPDGSWSGHMATCAAGMEHDRAATGFDHTTVINPVVQEAGEPGSA